MSTFFLKHGFAAIYASGGDPYYEGARGDPADLSVSQRPSRYHTHDGSQWALTVDAQIRQLRDAAAKDEADNPISPRGLAEMLLASVLAPVTMTPEQILAMPPNSGLRRLLEREMRQAARRQQITALGG